jgi:hypothetical protein
MRQNTMHPDPYPPGVAPAVEPENAEKRHALPCLRHGASKGRHDVFFDLAEIQSWMQYLPRMEVHVFDAGHLLLETHAAPAVSLMSDFIARSISPDRSALPRLQLPPAIR